MSRNGVSAVLACAFLCGGIAAAIWALWLPGAVGRAGSGADAPVLVFFFAAPISFTVFAILGAIIASRLRRFNARTTSLMWLLAVAATTYAALPWIRSLPT